MSSIGWPFDRTSSFSYPLLARTGGIRPAERRRSRQALTPADCEASIDASSAWFRPIVLTAISTILGMIPIAPTVFWGPMAFATMGGLLVATVLTLIFLPTLYVAWFERSERTPAKTAGSGA